MFTRVRTIQYTNIFLKNKVGSNTLPNFLKYNFLLKNFCFLHPQNINNFNISLYSSQIEKSVNSNIDNKSLMNETNDNITREENKYPLKSQEKAEFMNKRSKLAKKKRAKRKHGKKISLRYR